MLVRYARRQTGEAELVEVADEALDRLARESGETVNIGIPDAGTVELLAQRDSRHFLGSTNWVGRHVPAHASALGKVFFAFGSLALPPEPFERLTDATATSVHDLGLEPDSRVWLRDRRGRARARPLGGRGARARYVGCRDRGVERVRPHGSPPRRICSTASARHVRTEAAGLSALLGYDDRKRGVA